MIYIVDCGYQSVTAPQLRAALTGHGFTGIHVSNAGDNAFCVNTAEAVKPAEMAALLNRDFERHKPCGATFIDRITVTVGEVG